MMPSFIKDRTILLLDVVKEELDNAEPYTDPDNEDQMLQTYYLGSILSLTPSGKCYMPWAHSNVDGCPRCKGTGNIRNKHAKTTKCQKIINARIKLLETLRLGEIKSYWDLSKHVRSKSNKQNKQILQWEAYHSCPECAGTGSLEARLDEDWWKQLESELETIGAWSHGSDGDGCDIVVSRVARGDATKE